MGSNQIERGDLVMFWSHGSSLEEPSVGVVLDRFHCDDERYGDAIIILSGENKQTIPEVWCAKC